MTGIGGRLQKNNASLYSGTKKTKSRNAEIWQLSGNHTAGRGAQRSAKGTAFTVGKSGKQSAGQKAGTASAMKKAVEAGREAYLAGRMPRKLYSADPSSPTSGLIGS